MNDQPQPSISARSPLLRFVRWLFSWRGLRRILVVLAWTVTIFALFHGEENWRGRRAWRKYRQELEARGEELDLKSFIPKPVPDEQNFAATPFIQSWFVKRTAQWADNFSYAATRVSGPAKNDRANRNLVDLVDWEMAFAAVRSGELKPYGNLPSNTLDPESRAKAAPAVLEGLKSSGANLEELRSASSRPYSRYPIVYDLDNPWGVLIPHLANLKATCPRLRLKACAELAAGHSEKALEDVKLMLYLADSVKDEPFLMSYLVRLACLEIAIQPLWEGLAEHRWSEAQLQELQTRVQQYNFVSDLKRPLSGEKATGILTVDLIKKKGLGLLVTLAGPSSPPPSDRQLADLVGLLVPSGWYFQEQVNYCRLYQTGLGGTFDEAKKRISPAQIKSNSHALEREFVGGSSGVLFKGFEKFGLSLSPKGVYAFLHHRVIAALLLPDLSKVPLRAAIAQTTVDQAGLACALERYRLANRHFPEKLEELTPQFIPRLPQDVLTGEFYKYRRDQDTGFILYSVGWDEKDDGGVPGRTLWDEQAGDWVWRYPSK